MLLQPTAPPPLAITGTHHLAEVVSVSDVGSTGKIEVRLLAYDATETQDGRIVARLCVPIAGGNRGAFLIPDVGDEVLVAFLNGDRRQAVVVGALWNGGNPPAEALGGDGDRVDRWTLVGKRGTRIAIVEEADGAIIRLSTHDASGRDVAFCEISRENNGRIELSAGGSTLVLDQNGVSVETQGSLETKASTSTLESATVDVNAGQTSFSGHVTTPSIQATTVIGTTYTPGAGNVW